MTTISTFSEGQEKDFNCSMYEYWQRGARNLDEVDALQFMYKRISHAALREYVAHFAATLAEWGVRKGDVVTVCMPNVPVAVAALYGVSYIGAVSSVLHPLTPPEAVLETMQATNSKVLLCFDKLFTYYEKALVEAPIRVVLLAAGEYFSSLERAVIQRVNRVDTCAIRRATSTKYTADVVCYDSRKKVTPVEPSVGAGEELCLYLHSGGTTGVPKTIPITNRMINAEAHAIVHLCETPDIGKAAMLMVLPIFHGFGIAVCLHAMLPYGFRVVLQAAFDPKQSVRIIKRKHITYLAGVPTMFEKMLATGDFKGKGLKSLCNAYCGGDALPAPLKEQFDQACREAGSRCRLYQGYGLTETVAVCCAHSPFTDDREGSIGKPAEGVLMRIAGDDDGTLAVGERGEICVAGDTVMGGYADGTPDGVLAEHDGRIWLHTGDCGYVDEDGYYHFVGRKKRMSIIAGVNVYHQEIEQLASKMDGVNGAAVCEVTVKGKTAVKLYVVSPEGQAIVKPLLAYLKMHLTKYCVPRYVEVIDKIPLTAMGKIDFKALMARN